MDQRAPADRLEGVATSVAHAVYQATWRLPSDTGLDSRVPGNGLGAYQAIAAWSRQATRLSDAFAIPPQEIPLRGFGYSLGHLSAIAEAMEVAGPPF